MEKSFDVRLEVPLQMLRDLVNKLAVISGHCDLLGDDLKEGSQCAKRVRSIQEIARELNEYQCRLLAAKGVSSVVISPLPRKAGSDSTQNSTQRRRAVGMEKTERKTYPSGSTMGAVR
jgi:hypothetical protein